MSQSSDVNSVFSYDEIPDNQFICMKRSAGFTDSDTPPFVWITKYW